MSASNPAALVRHLQGVLAEAAADGFEGAMKEGVGSALRLATDRVVAGVVAPPHLIDQLAKFRGGLERFEERGRQDRSRVVAHGLRIAMGLRAHVGSDQTPKKAKKTSSRTGVQGPGRAPKAAPASKASKASKKTSKKASSKTDPKTGARASSKAAKITPKVGATDVFSTDSPVSVLKGVGAKTADKLAAAGLGTIGELLHLIPLRYEDRRTPTSWADLREDEPALLEGVIARYRSGWWGGRFRATMVLREEEGPGEITAQWFHPVGGMNQRVETGTRVMLAGVPKSYKGRLGFVHPEVVEADADSPGIVVTYPTVEGMARRTLGRLCRQAAERVSGGVDDPLPPALLEAHGLPALGPAFDSIHRPAEDLSAEGLALLAGRRSPAHRRLAFDEFFELQLALLSARSSRTEAGHRAPTPLEEGWDREVLRSCLPFEPTGAQWRSVEEIAQDMGQTAPMLRLLQGDVGSGKTVVAFACALAMARSGVQTAVMAPTEILAQQHFKTLAPWCEAAGLRIDLLTGSMGKAQRRSALALLESGSTAVVVGTHALLVQDVRFKELGLVVVDEQHRFGVEQRTLLREKGHAPHLLVMTATPIPRSLALTAFGELDVSVIDELPPGRRPVTTEIIYGKNSLDGARERFLEEVRAGGQGFVVCPLVEASEAVDASDVHETAASMDKMLGGTGRVELVHGRMAPKDKETAMARFRAGEASVLVATTVIEVGVDVPGATAILVEHGERFGLAQLHQLRGRVGRSQDQSLRAPRCFVHTAFEKRTEVGERLAVLAESTDGFVVAERDLELRGPGELFGTRQSGAPLVAFRGLGGDGVKLLVEAREAARGILGEDPSLAGYPKLLARLRARLERQAVYSGDSG